MLRLLSRAALAVAAVALVVPLLPAAAATADSSRPVPVKVPANYTLTSGYNGDIAPLRGWQIEWVVPGLTHPTPTGGESAAIGQWYWNLETGFYYFQNNWYVYYFGDSDTTGDNFSDCVPDWGSGGFCFGFPVNAGQHVTFTYEYCNASKAFDVNAIYVCAYADLNNGTGRHFLAQDSRTNPDGTSVTKEMYAHDIESFPPPGSADEVQVSCAQPTTMVSQKVRWGGGPFQTLRTTNWWLRVASDVNVFYDFQNINLTAATPTWQSCSPPPPVCTPPNPYWDTSTVYNSPNVVAWNRHRYRAKWYTQGEIPGTGEAWQDLGSC